MSMSRDLAFDWMQGSQNTRAKGSCLRIVQCFSGSVLQCIYNSLP